MTTQTTQRAYTVDEVDRMRKAISWSYPDGVSYYPAERAADIENRIRTYMAAGVSPEELERKRNEQAYQKQKRSMGS